MFKIFANILLLSLAVSGGVFFPVSSVSANIFEYDYSVFSKIPVLDQGRIKPLDTFARTNLKIFSGKDSLGGTSAIEWLVEVLMDGEKAYRRNIFNIPNPKVVDALELGRREGHRYSYNEVAESLARLMKTFHPLFSKKREELTLAQKQLLDVYDQLQVFRGLSGSLTLFFPDFQIMTKNLGDVLGLTQGKTLTYVDIRKKRKVIQDLFEGVNKKRKEGQKLEKEESELLALVRKIRDREQDGRSRIFSIIPPQWDNQGEQWFTPWSITQAGLGSPESARFLGHWEQLVKAYRGGDNKLWSDLSEKIRISSANMMKPADFSGRLSFEVFFNRCNFFVNSLIFYLGAFLIIFAGFLFWQGRMRVIALTSLLVGFSLHALGICSRMYIMGRPPVTNLYESIIFVGLIVVLFAIILEWREKNSLGLIVGGSMGSALHFLGFKYNAGGDTMGMLAAVLDTNFWLATHVVTITVGYGCCFVGGVIGHVYLLQRLFRPDRKRLTELYRNMIGVSFVALFFSTLGTILGGIWADQSWGRFWGWDPKENGALLIVLWLIVLVHGRLSRILGEMEFAVGMVWGNAIVAIAWFGVNLLNVGLHSYGFTENAAFNLGMFCGIEFLFAVVCYGLIRSRKVYV